MAQQQPEEVLGTYLFRLRQMAEYAFGNELLETKRSRVLWRFIAGMNNDFIRQEVLRQKWMAAEGKPKEYLMWQKKPGQFKWGCEQLDR